jgi:predicted acylesterase/phospholipase RssA
MYNEQFEIRIRSNSSEFSKNIFAVEGGGTKGIYAIGVLKYLFEENPYINLQQVEIFAGTSVGSYLSVALSLGYQAEDFIELSKDIDTSKVTGSKYLIITNLSRFIIRGYIYNDTGRKDVIKKILDRKMNYIRQHLSESDNFTFEDLTFGHLRTLIGSYPDIYRHLLINTVDLNRSEQIFITTLENMWDNIRIVDALLASSSIPFVFKPIILYYDPDSGTYGYQKKENYLDIHLYDGGLSTNNPLDYFLIHDDVYSGYNIWLLKFTNQPKYVKIKNTIELFIQVLDYLISGKNDTKMDMIRDKFRVNVINLLCNAGSLDIYNQEEIQKIIENVYDSCVRGKLYVEK